MLDNYNDCIQVHAVILAERNSTREMILRLAGSRNATLGTPCHFCGSPIFKHSDYSEGICGTCHRPERREELLKLIGKDGKTCQKCGSHNDGKELPYQVHHRDNNRYHNCKHNLAVLCGTCNKHAHAMLRTKGKIIGIRGMRKSYQLCYDQPIRSKLTKKHYQSLRTI